MWYAIGMTKEQLVEDLKVMAEADMEHLMEALSKGDRVHAHTFVDSLIDSVRRIEDIEAGRE